MTEPRFPFLRWGAMLRRHPSALLLGAQLLSLLLYPLMDDTPRGRVLFGAVALVVVPLAVWVVRRSPSVNWIAWALALPAISLSLIAIAFDMPRVLAWSSVLEAALYFYAAGGLISYMLHDHRVTADELFAAGATFTLLAWGFAYAYFVCQAWYPDSFTGLVHPERPRRWIELLYLSFTTLSGVGIGDILPINAPARVLVMLEQFAGVGYIAAVVSRLIGLSILRQQRDNLG
ncbi:potassium channel family protein [Montanilutibacter psychrotolerans]|uniref:Two pore domain potassium channel family protein n=1 Tax=Montanilutibacter psychrotolerans TaxID=1327343 RepID=A0A3M8SKS8_9GAMM|nr:potassium channel family protein [Lysobacter psychrotolerans]RNF81911.1 two pore domain potassium channel family protein [Lysobacter psychrotolerans]